ncbi:uncharacterized protein EHS24_006616 [Apiotrichum porosum]|uniref:Uncharacterized protein n=1 Tax=Apiotrichum porosum TaxID=105984 RepID=A0A427Y1R8_9TREE|nr:uncharacterized protein EHS24_006616 [Apiotrichum porosum]RSH85029.1 hypothetical protein EHS24_006616 [Apiotrichum porosum]
MLPIKRFARVRLAAEVKKVVESSRKVATWPKAWYPCRHVVCPGLAGQNTKHPDSDPTYELVRLSYTSSNPGCRHFNVRPTTTFLAPPPQPNLSRLPSFRLPHVLPKGSKKARPLPLLNRGKQRARRSDWESNPDYKNEETGRRVEDYDNAEVIHQNLVY